MGREIRRVPEGWEHPTGDNGEYKPLYNQTYKEAAKEWWDGCLAWSKGEHERQNSDYVYFWDYWGAPPMEEDEVHIPEFESLPNHYQIYETVSEGTPTSPVFKNLDFMKVWLIKKGYSESAAENFTKSGWVPSMIVADGVIKQGIECAEDL